MQSTHATDDVPRSPYTIFFERFRKVVSSLSPGLVYLAVSSSYDPLDKGVFCDADAAERENPISVFTPEEAMKYIAMKRENGSFPPHVPSTEIMIQLSGCVPRMLSFFQTSSLHLTRSAEDCSVEDILTVYKKRCCMYYVERVEHILNKSWKSKDKRSLLQVPILVSRNSTITSMPRLWENSGMFVCDHSIWYPVCEMAKIAIITELKDYDKFGEIISFFASIPQTRWLALEAAFLRILQPSGTFEIGAKGLDGKVLRRMRDAGYPRIAISVQQVIFQDTIRPLPSPLQPGTMIVCYPRFPVIDFFVYTMDRLKCFIKISLQKYSQHNAQLHPDLFDPSKMKGQSVYFYFSKLCDDNSTGAETVLPADSYYIYITSLSDSDAFVPLHEDRQDVVLVTRDDMRESRLFEDYLLSSESPHKK